MRTISIHFLDELILAVIAIHRIIKQNNGVHMWETEQKSRFMDYPFQNHQINTTHNNYRSISMCCFRYSCGKCFSTRFRWSIISLLHTERQYLSFVWLLLIIIFGLFFFIYATKISKHDHKTSTKEHILS